VLHPQGFEVQIEGAAFVRLDPQEDRDLRSADYRFGVPVVYGIGRWQTKLAYYHNSAHLGDEAMLKHPDFTRINYVRDCIVWGNSYYLFDWLRLYGEVGYAFFNSGGSQPWEFQYGTELIQARPTGALGAPFLAVNGMSRQELDRGGNVCVQTGWAWRGRASSGIPWVAAWPGILQHGIRSGSSGSSWFRPMGLPATGLIMTKHRMSRRPCGCCPMPCRDLC
jgi:hypothetical protein